VRAAAALLATAALVLVGARVAAPSDPAERFLDRYVEDDGRVVRHDQGGDTVSEGQAYALLLAVAADDEERFARVWRWTDANLRRHDGLLAWR
jgi:endo-1,4-beta-D-glucanase Y